MRRLAHRAATGRHAIADELLSTEHVEQLKLEVIRICARLGDATDNERLDAQNRPVVEIDIHAGGRPLQHVLPLRWRESSTALQIGGDNRRDVERRIRRLAVEAERHHGDRRLLADALGDANRQFGARRPDCEQ